MHALVLVAGAVPIAVAAGLELARGWRPTSDDAAIAWRTFDVFTAHAPLVGAFNDATVSASRPVFDPGPLEYYLLAVPERIDTVHGVLWGAAVVCIALVVLAVEAAWRAGGPIGGPVAATAVAAGAAVFAATQPTAMINLPWNPNLGAYAFGATLVLAVVAGTGRLGWWPVAVVTGSLAAQCHLIFAPASLAALAVALGFGLVHRLRRAGGDPAGATRSGRLRPLLPVALGLGLGLLTLAAPLGQQLATQPGNLTLLARNLGRGGASLGLGFGLRAVDQVAGLPPAFARTAPPLTGDDWYLHFLHDLFGGSVAGGIALLVACAVVSVAAAAWHRVGLAALAGVAAASGLVLAATFGAIKSPFVSITTYTDVALWPVGMLVDATLVWAAAELAAAGARRLRPRLALDRARATVTAAVASAVVLVPLCTWSVAAVAPATATSGGVIGGWTVAHAVGPLASTLERERPAGAVLVEPAVQLLPNGLSTWALTEALAYRLHADGYDARLPAPMQPEVGPDAAPVGGERVYLVQPDGPGRWRLVAVARARPVHVLSAVGVRP